MPAQKKAKKKSVKKKAARPAKSVRKPARSKKTVRKPVARKKKDAKRARARVVKKKVPAKTSKPVKKPLKKQAAAKPATPVSKAGKAKPLKRGKGSEYMSAAQVKHFRKLLTNWKIELMEEVDRTVHHMQDEASNFPDPNDRATQEEEFALELRTRDRERKLIKKINEALATLETGDYGYCEICGIEIGISRLEARPTATLCIDCKTLDEIKERQLG